MNELMNLIPEGTAVIGYAVGLAAEQRAVRDIQENRQALMASWQPDEEAGAAVDVDQHGRRNAILTRATAQMAIWGAVAGFAAGHATLGSSTVHKVTPAGLEVVVDHNGHVNVDGAKGHINSLANMFSSNGKLRAEAVLAHFGSADTVDMSAVEQDQIWGRPSVADAVGTAFDNANRIQSSLTNKAPDHTEANVGILTITDGNPVGNPDTLAQASKNGNIPVFVANTGNDTGPVANELRQVAAKTGGAYFGSQTSANKIADAIHARLTAHISTKETVHTDRGAWGAVAIAAALGFARQFRRRRSETAIS